MPVRPGIFSYRGWTALSVLFVVLFGWAPECGAAENPLDLVLVMDNSTSMAVSDPDFVMLASADLVVGLLRPGDRVHLVSSGANASIVLSGTGEDREKFREALTRLHREASASDPVAVLDLLMKHFSANQGKRYVPLVFWFTGRHFSYDVTNPDYYPGDLQQVLDKVQDSKTFLEDPFKVKAFRDIQPQVIERIGQLVQSRVETLDAMEVPVQMVLGGEKFEAPANLDEQVQAFMTSIPQETGGRLLPRQDKGTGMEQEVLSRFISVVNAPTQTVVPDMMGRKGESFEVFRGCRHMWVVLIFDRPPLELSFSSEDITSEVIKTWPFGKPEQDVYSVKPYVEKGLSYKSKRWYRLPENPVGYALFSVRDPLPGNYRIRVRFDKGVPYVMRIIQDVDLVYGFLDEPADSIPLGMEFSAVAALKNPEGYTYVFNRDFVDGLVFKVLMRSIDGSLPEWGEVQVLEPSREGETSFNFSPDAPGTYFLKGKVTHSNGEFVAFMQPHRVDVHPRIPLDFEPVTLTWSSTNGEGWTDLAPALKLSRGVKLPKDVEFTIHVDTQEISGVEHLVFEPGESFIVSRDSPDVSFRVRYREPDTFRIRGEKFKGTLRLRVDESQRQIVQGTGEWEIPVRGGIASWGVGRIHHEYQMVLYLGLAVLLAVFLVVERLLRPSFARDLRFQSKEAIGGKDRKHVIEASRIFKPPIPFMRHKIIVGRGGDVGLYREDVLCVIVPTREGFDICPRSGTIVYEDADGDDVEMDAPFAGELEMRYRVKGDSGKLEFLLTLARGARDGSGKGAAGRKS